MSRDVREHLEEFVRSRPGVEAYLEPRTAVLEPTVALVASTGEWTRRPVGSPKSARTFTERHRIPLYDAGLVGYPERMRTWSAASAAG